MLPTLPVLTMEQDVHLQYIVNYHWNKHWINRGGLSDSLYCLSINYNISGNMMGENMIIKVLHRSLKLWINTGINMACSAIGSMFIQYLYHPIYPIQSMINSWAWRFTFIVSAWLLHTASVMHCLCYTICVRFVRNERIPASYNLMKTEGFRELSRTCEKMKTH